MAAGHCEPYSIFVSQADYPLKGLHYLLQALPQIREKYPRVQVYVAGNDLTAYHTLKEKLKISAYGQYLRDLIREGQLEDCVHFTGRLTEQQMRERFLEVICSCVVPLWKIHRIPWERPCFWEFPASARR